LEDLAPFFLGKSLSQRARRQASLQGVVDCVEDLIDGDLPVIVVVTSGTGRHVHIPESYVHHGEQLIDGNRTVAAAVADAGGWSRSGARLQVFISEGEIDVSLTGTGINGVAGSAASAVVDGERLPMLKTTAAIKIQERD
jgi:hypothetical protein